MYVRIIMISHSEINHLIIDMIVLRKNHYVRILLNVFFFEFVIIKKIWIVRMKRNICFIACKHMYDVKYLPRSPHQDPFIYLSRILMPVVKIYHHLYCVYGAYVEAIHLKMVNFILRMNSNTSSLI